MIMFAIVVLVIIVLIILSTLGNNSRSKNIPYLHEVYYHRGYYNNKDLPENSMKAFRKCIDKGYGIELDVQLTKDKKVIVFHDDDIKRMTGVNLNIKDTEYEELKKYHLLDTEEIIPEFEEVLKANGFKSPLYIEIKDFSMHYHELVDKTVELCDRYPGNYIFCSFNPMVLMYLKKIRPELLRGIIVQRFKKGNYIAGKILENMFLNFMIKPDIISYQYNKPNWSLKLNKLFHNTLAGWAIKTYEDYENNTLYDMPVIERFDHRTKEKI